MLGFSLALAIAAPLPSLKAFAACHCIITQADVHSVWTESVESSDPEPDQDREPDPDPDPEPDPETDPDPDPDRDEPG